jgi:hypothetical protein
MSDESVMTGVTHHSSDGAPASMLSESQYPGQGLWEAGDVNGGSPKLPLYNQASTVSNRSMHRRVETNSPSLKSKALASAGAKLHTSIAVLAQDLAGMTQADEGDQVGESDRDTFAGTAEALAEVLAVHAREKSTVICTYRDESPKTSDAKLYHGVDGIEGNHRFSFCDKMCKDPKPNTAI